jgi:hypothetical protein
MMKPNHSNNHMMSASSVQYQKSLARGIRVLSPFLRQLNTRSLALILFLAFALLSTTRGKEAESRESASAGSTKSKVVINKQHDGVRCVATKTAGQMLPSLRQGYLRVYSVSDDGEFKPFVTFHNLDDYRSEE